MRDVLGIAVGVVIALLAQIIQPWTPWWWAGMTVATVLAVFSAGHLIWRWWRSAPRTHETPTRAALVALLVVILAGEYGYSSGYFDNWVPSFIPTSPSSAPATPEPLPIAPIQSRLSRFIFACDIPMPQTSDDEEKRKESVQTNVEAWANTLGVRPSFSDIKNGMQITVEAKTKEAKLRFVSMGLVPGITKVILESRWIDRRQIVVAYAAQLPKDFESMAGMIPDPSWPQLTEAENLVARFLGAPEGACYML